MSTASFLALAAFIACTALHGGRGVWAKTPAPLPPAPAPLPPAPASSSPIPVPVPPTLPPAPASLPPAIPSTTTPSPSPSMSSGTDCTTALFNLTSCLTYVEAGSTVPTPDKECCPALAGLMDSNPICLCELLAGGAENFGIKIDDSKALKLPSICKVKTPPPSTCTELGYHVPNVAMAPAPASTSGGPELPGSATASPPMTAGSSPVPRAAGLFSLAGLSFFSAAMVQILI